VLLVNAFELERAQMRLARQLREACFVLVGQIDVGKGDRAFDLARMIVNRIAVIIVIIVVVMVAGMVVLDLIAVAVFENCAALRRITSNNNRVVFCR